MLVKHNRKRSKQVGLPPGTLIHVGEKKSGTVRIRQIIYNETHFEEKELSSIDECPSSIGEQAVTWISIEGLHQVDIIEKIGQRLDLHPLVLEDILDTRQRPKMSDFEDYLLVFAKMLSYQEGDEYLESEQLSLILGHGYVISFQETAGDFFDVIVARLETGKDPIRRKGADYLAYALLDAVVDNYFHVLEKIGEDGLAMEEQLIAEPGPETLQQIQSFKRQLISIRKCVWPLREVIGALERGEPELIQDKTKIFLRDVYEHTIQVMDTVETYRDMASGMFDVYLSSMSHRMNEIMKVLTIFASIFIPLTLITGIYGMNFNSQKSPFNMPELSWYYGYPFALGLMVVVAVALFFFCKKKKWL
jgi:magnesium transporter